MYVLCILLVVVVAAIACGVVLSNDSSGFSSNGELEVGGGTEQVSSVGGSVNTEITEQTTLVEKDGSVDDINPACDDDTEHYVLGKTFSITVDDSMNPLTLYKANVEDEGAFTQVRHNSRYGFEEMHLGTFSRIVGNVAQF